MKTHKLQVKLFKALAHPVRLKIVKKLMCNKFCVCELSEKIEFTQSNLSQHLKILKDAGILISKKNGLKVNYKIYNDTIKEIINLSEKMILENINNIK